MRRFAVSVYVSPRSYISKDISTSGTKSAILDCLAAAHYYQAKDHTCRHNMNKLVLLVFFPMAQKPLLEHDNVIQFLNTTQ